ncbi:hypothetical protein GGF42_005271 [Coemansia sp. RSA 2424]|nr:hypothetical protein GGF42_005271 [Coemansia sp. RSA 2424]
MSISDNDDVFARHRPAYRGIVVDRVMNDYLNILSPLIPKGKEDDKKHVIAVGPWLDECEELLVTGEVPKKWYVALATKCIPRLTSLQYRSWCKEEKKDKDNWSVFKSFIYHRFSGVVSTLDAYTKWRAMTAPRNSSELEKFINDFQLLARMANLEVDSPQVAMEFVARMPADLFQRVLAQSTSKDKLSLPALVVMANAHFRAQEVCRGSPMEIDAMEKTSWRGSSGLPHFSLVEHLCTLEQYNDRTKRNVCLGCEGDHQWRKCPRRKEERPKGHKD